MAYSDPVVQHIAGLVQTALGTSAVKSVLRHPPAFMPPDGKLPCLAVYRTEEYTTGREAARQRARVNITIAYYLGRFAHDAAEDAWSTLPAIASTVRRTIAARKHASYETGKTLSVLAGIEEITMGTVQYRAGLPASDDEPNSYPAFQATVEVLYEDTGWATKTVLTAINIDHNEPAAHEVPATSQGAPVSSTQTP